MTIKNSAKSKSSCNSSSVSGKQFSDTICHKPSYNLDSESQGACVSANKKLRNIYVRLYFKFGPQKWWPAETRFEVMIGAILTQNTNWKNVQKAVSNLKTAGVMSIDGINKTPEKRLAELIKPAGYYNMKAKRVKNFMSFLCSEYDFSLKKMAREAPEVLREKLLSVNGVGPETADSIVLYAFDKLMFVVDAYTKRIMLRHNLIDEEYAYHDIQKFLTENIKNEVGLFNEYHALLVRLGNEYCKSKPLCDECPLKNLG